MSGGWREELTKEIAGVVGQHNRALDGSGNCQCGFVRSSPVDPGTWRWHVAAAVVGALQIEPAPFITATFSVPGPPQCFVFGVLGSPEENQPSDDPVG